MTDTELILSALNGAPPIKRKIKIIPDIEPTPIVYDKVIAELSKKVKKKIVRPVARWTNTDFLRYAEKSLAVEGLVLEMAVIRDRELMGKLHDKLATHFQERMSHELLRSYIDWWIHSHARILRQRSVYPQMFLLDKYIEMFIAQYGDTKPTEIDSIKAPQGKVLTNLELYELGGLPMLLMTEGIVVSHRVLTEIKSDSVFKKLSEGIRALSKDAVEKVVSVTLEKSPYNTRDAVDFVSIAKPALDFYGIKKFANIKYMECFQ